MVEYGVRIRKGGPKIGKVVVAKIKDKLMMF